jgi:hypothetical protein
MHCSIYCFAVLEAALTVVGSRYPLISYVFTFPKHWHRFLQGEARPVPVWPPLESRQGAVLRRSARRNGASKWRQTLQTCGGDLDEQAESF